jgi:hypothetical protein
MNCILCPTHVFKGHTHKLPIKRVIVTHFSVIYYHENYLIVKRKTYDQHQQPFLRLELHMYKIYRIIVF